MGAVLIGLAACGNNPGDGATDTPAATSTTTRAVTSPEPVGTATVPPGTTSVVTAGSQSAVVTSVTDGDTIRVDHPGGTDVPVRLIGINAPETDECFAVEARAALAGMVGTAEIRMVPDESDIDRFGRLLRYVYLLDGTFVNEELVRRGFALAREYPPDTTRSSVLAAAQLEAERNAAGLWATDACGAAFSAILTITHIEFDPPGDDHDNTIGEWVEIENHGSDPVDMGGWVLRDESATHRYGFPSGFTLTAGASVRVTTGCGPDSPTELHWCNDLGAVWNNDGDTAFLLDANGNIHATRGYQQDG